MVLTQVKVVASNVSKGGCGKLQESTSKVLKEKILDVLHYCHSWASKMTILDVLTSLTFVNWREQHCENSKQRRQDNNEDASVSMQLCSMQPKAQGVSSALVA